jgi:cytochrome c biogenesis protein CcmG, thiol:disulfide interchange protein DsbE
MNWKRAMWGVLLSVPALALLAFGMTKDPRDIPSPLPGREAPGFTLEVLGTEAEARTRTGGAGMQLQGLGPLELKLGDTVSLAQHLGEVVVINFWASWCLACRTEHRDLSRAAVHYGGGPVHFYGLLYNDSPDNGRRWIQQMGGQTYPALVDPGARTAISYGLYGVPETFVIGPDGKVAYKHVGPVTEEILRQVIDPLLPEAGEVDQLNEATS